VTKFVGQNHGASMGVARATGYRLFRNCSRPLPLEVKSV
jgi:hypothetical protein